MRKARQPALNALVGPSSRRMCAPTNQCFGAPGFLQENGRGRDHIAQLTSRLRFLELLLTQSKVTLDATQVRLVSPFPP